ncbi:hypothetical protein RB601_006013 [Gaeumannomyces tritici]
MKSFGLIKGLALLAGLVASAPVASRDESLDLFPREPAETASPAVELLKRQSCNTESNRACWSPGFNINTDYESNTPNTGVTRRYNLVVTEVDNYVGGDGLVKSKAMLINNQFPGPIIKADWGDWVEVTVTNRLRTNGTSMHWHGVRMLNNNPNDGANGITECPIPPNASKVYRFRVEQYGTAWYHSHFSGQYGNGVVGTLLFNGPASLPYQEDLGVYPITDWYYRGADEIQFSLIPSPGVPPPSDNILFNGSHVNAQGGGSYNRVKLKPGRRHRLRIINTSVDNTFTVSLVGHQFTVIQTDFVPVNAFTTSQIFLGIGQRYDVTIEANQPVGNYWFNVTFAASGLCGTSLIQKPASIFQYEGASDTALPTNPGPTPTESLCEDLNSWTPVVAKNVPRASFSAVPGNTLEANTNVENWEGRQRVYWEINGSDMNITWDEPTLEYLVKGNMNFPQNFNVFQVPQGNQWSFWIIQNPTVAPHPMHLHGHDFYLLGRSPAQTNPFAGPVRRFNAATDLATLRFDNPVRRDVTMLPANGWIVVAFRTDNPGAWLFHCHIAWHVAQGLSVQFLERVQDIPSAFPLSAIEPTCSQWTAYYATSPHKQHDSGL